MDAPTFNHSGYPTEETLEAIKNWPLTDATSYRELIEFVGVGWEYPDCFRRHGLTYTLITAGWSGNEALVNALENNYPFDSLCWMLSQRGGKHVYRIPNPGTFDAKASQSQEPHRPER